VLFEETFEPDGGLPRLLASVEAWTSPDLSIEVETAWDLLQPGEGAWTLQPARVSILGYGPDFEREYGEDFRLEFGQESLFLPGGDAPGSFRFAERNIRSLLKRVADCDGALPLEKRLLWTEGGGNLAARLEEIVRETR
jgi:hypothetical protein